MTIHHKEGHCCPDCGEPLGVPAYSEGILPPCENPDCETNQLHCPECGPGCPGYLEVPSGDVFTQPSRMPCPTCAAVSCVASETAERINR